MTDANDSATRILAATGLDNPNGQRAMPVVVKCNTCKRRYDVEAHDMCPTCANGQAPERPGRNEVDDLGDAIAARFVSGGTFILDAPETVPAVWGRDDEVMWSEGEGLLIVGPTGVGKTTITGQLVKGRLGLCDEVLGFPVAAGERNVLYLACDRPKQVQRALRRLFDEDNRNKLNERVIVWPGPPPADVARHPETLIMLAERANADTLIIDSLKDVAIGLSDDEVGAGLNMAMQRVLADDIELIGLHHQRKGGHGEKPKGLADVYGSTWITAGAGSVVLLWGEAGDPLVELRHLKQPAAEVGPFTVEHDHVRGLSTVFRGFDALRFLRGRPRGTTATEMAHAWFEKDKPTDNERKKAERALKALEKKGLARRDDGGRPGFGGTGGTRFYATELARSVTTPTPP